MDRFLQLVSSVLGKEMAAIFDVQRLPPDTRQKIIKKLVVESRDEMSNDSVAQNTLMLILKTDGEEESLPFILSSAQSENYMSRHLALQILTRKARKGSLQLLQEDFDQLPLQQGLADLLVYLSRSSTVAQTRLEKLLVNSSWLFEEPQLNELASRSNGDLAKLSLAETSRRAAISPLRIVSPTWRARLSADELSRASLTPSETMHWITQVAGKLDLPEVSLNPTSINLIRPGEMACTPRVKYSKRRRIIGPIFELSRETADTVAVVLLDLGLLGAVEE